mmetsp:Transcript_23881/g.42315  ORF Transcript_23881/g.42315 Transcript_23881/m.42315 type:complete len:327 (+) Transcript_23881:11-991(+)
MIYNTFRHESGDYMEEEIVADFRKSVQKAVCSGRLLLCSVCVTLLGLGGVYCLIATASTIDTKDYETNLLWGSFLGIIANFSAMFSMIGIYWLSNRNRELEDLISRYEKSGCHSRIRTASTISEAKDISEGWKQILKGEGTIERLARSTDDVLHAIRDIEDNKSSPHWLQQGLRDPFLTIKKAALTQEASLMHQLSTEMKRMKTIDSLGVDKEDWSLILNRIPRSDEREISFSYLSKGRGIHIIGWDLAREAINKFVKKRIRSIARSLDQLDSYPEEGNDNTHTAVSVKLSEPEPKPKGGTGKATSTAGRDENLKDDSELDRLDLA